MKNNKNLDLSFIGRIESELLSKLLVYAVPFLDERINSNGAKKEKRENKKPSLESLVVSKPKIDFEDIKELGSLILRDLSQNAKINKSTTVNSQGIFYSLSIRKQKNPEEKIHGYSVSIEYEENESSDSLKISIKKSDKEVYSAEIANIKEQKDHAASYGIKISYEDNYGEERLSMTYRQQLKSYIQKHIGDKEDMSNRVPLKWLNILPETVMGGVLGFTYVGENFMGRRADLTGKTARMVDIHESIHTPDEYETRCLTSWIMEKARSKYVK